MGVRIEMNLNVMHDFIPCMFSLKNEKGRFDRFNKPNHFTEGLFIYVLLFSNEIKSGLFFVNPLYSGGLFHPYILEESICYLRDMRFNF